MELIADDVHLLISDDVDLLISQALTARSSSQALATSHTGLTWSKLHGAIANLQEVFCRQFLMRKNCFCTSVIRGTMKTPSLHCQTANDVHVYVASGQKNVLQAGHLFEYILQNVGSCPRVSDSKEAWRRRQEQSPARPSVRPCVRPSDRPLVRPSDHLSDRPSVRPSKKEDTSCKELANSSLSPYMFGHGVRRSCNTNTYVDVPTHVQGANTVA